MSKYEKIETGTSMDGNPLVRYYKLPRRISKTRFNGRDSTIEDIFTSDPLTLADGVKLDDDISTSIGYVAISDSRQHIERICFPAFFVIKDGRKILTHRHNGIAGCNTFLIHGGDVDSIYQDEVYIRSLLMLNKDQ